MTPACSVVLDASTLGDGLVSWWRAEGNANDSVGSNNGVAQNGVTYVPGPPSIGGQAFEFNGTTADILIPSSTTLDLKSSFSFAFWIKVSALPTQPILVMAKLVPNVEQKDIALNTNGTFGVTLRGQGIVSFGSATPISVGAWHFAVLTFDGSTASFYLDGAIDAVDVQSSGQIGNSTGALSFAHNATQGGGFLAGDLDELRWYSRGLSASEVAALYAGCN